MFCDFLMDLFPKLLQAWKIMTKCFFIAYDLTKLDDKHKYWELKHTPSFLFLCEGSKRGKI